MKVYISGPMTGLPNFNREAFDVAAVDLEAMGYQVANPASVSIENGTWGQYMREDLVMLLRCDAVLALPGWRKSRGARIEIGLAKKLGMRIYDYPSLREIKLGAVFGIPYRRKWGSEYLCSETDAVSA